MCIKFKIQIPTYLYISVVFMHSMHYYRIFLKVSKVIFPKSADVFFFRNSRNIGIFQLNEWHCFVSNSGQKKSTKNLEKMDFKKEAITQLYMRLLFDNSKTNTAVRIPYILLLYIYL